MGTRCLTQVKDEAGNKIRLWWTSADGLADLDGGEYDTICQRDFDAFEQTLIDQCATEGERREIGFGTIYAKVAE